MQCKKCKTVIPDDSSFCPICGKSVPKKREIYSKVSLAFKKLTLRDYLLLVIAIGVWCIVLQNAGVFNQYTKISNDNYERIPIDGHVYGSVDAKVTNTVDVHVTSLY